MAFFLPSLGFGNLFYAGVLLANALAVLSEDRFLARIGFSSTSQTEPAFGGQPDTTSIRSKIISLLSSVRLLGRLPLIVVNFVVIVYLLLLG